MLVRHCNSYPDLNFSQTQTPKFFRLRRAIPPEIHDPNRTILRPIWPILRPIWTISTQIVPSYDPSGPSYDPIRASLPNSVSACQKSV